MYTFVWKTYLDNYALFGISSFRKTIGTSSYFGEINLIQLINNENQKHVHSLKM